ncbi:hypothetical protein IF2G_07233 [Cordyceps javanica]|nr:hypothetical protein IF2G_07233 [Cordyceps javanica]
MPHLYSDRHVAPHDIIDKPVAGPLSYSLSGVDFISARLVRIDKSFAIAFQGLPELAHALAIQIRIKTTQCLPVRSTAAQLHCQAEPIFNSQNCIQSHCSSSRKFRRM